MSSRRRTPRGPGIVLRGIGAGTGSGWSERIVGRLGSILDEERLRRGRQVARSGYVLSLRVGRGVVRGEVQGSQPDPFEPTFTVRELDRYDRAELVEQVRAAPGVLASLAAGVVPPELADRLLPADSADIDFDCTCPDFGWPCKHAAALALLTAQEVEDRPMQMLKLRGVDVTMLIDAIAAEGDEGAADGDGADADVGGRDRDAGDAGDHRGAELFAPRGPLPPLPVPPEDASAAIDLLDTVRLRAALRLWGPETADAEAELERMYRRLTGED